MLTIESFLFLRMVGLKFWTLVLGKQRDLFHGILLVWRLCPHLQRDSTHYSTVSRVWHSFGTWILEKLLENTKATPEQLQTKSNQVDGLLSMRNLTRTITAWSISLNPKGGTYAATGSSGNITIHSADPSSFGQLKSTLSSGRSKFGMFCTHVRARC
jgi:hypothetical protein